MAEMIPENEIEQRQLSDGTVGRSALGRADANQPSRWILL